MSEGKYFLLGFGVGAAVAVAVSIAAQRILGRGKEKDRKGAGKDQTGFSDQEKYPLVEAPSKSAMQSFPSQATSWKPKPPSKNKRQALPGYTGRIRPVPMTTSDYRFDRGIHLAPPPPSLPVEECIPNEERFPELREMAKQMKMARVADEAEAAKGKAVAFDGAPEFPPPVTGGWGEDKDMQKAEKGKADDDDEVLQEMLQVTGGRYADGSRRTPKLEWDELDWKLARITLHKLGMRWGPLEYEEE